MQQTRKPSVALSIALLATGLYATHTFVPPTPGPIAAAGNLSPDDQLGLVILFGLAVALVATSALIAPLVSAIGLDSLKGILANILYLR